MNQRGAFLFILYFLTLPQSAFSTGVIDTNPVHITTHYLLHPSLPAGASTSLSIEIVRRNRGLLEIKGGASCAVEP